MYSSEWYWEDSLVFRALLFRLARSEMENADFTLRPSEDETKGLVPRPSGAGKRESANSARVQDLPCGLIPFIFLSLKSLILYEPYRPWTRLLSNFVLSASTSFFTGSKSVYFTRLKARSSTRLFVPSIFRKIS